MTIESVAALTLAHARPVDQLQQQGRAQPNAANVAQQFEGLLMQQLWSIMRKTAGGLGGGNGPGAGMYAHMMDEAVAGQLTRAGGLGLAAQLERGMGGSPQRSYPMGESFPLVPRDAGLEPRRSAPLVLGPATGQRVAGATSILQDTAESMLTPVSAPRWGRDGRLTRAELSSDYQTEALGGIARFNVRDAAGFEGRYKCNLFAFEMVRRAGFQVPLMPRTRGWGYPHPDAVTVDAADGRLRHDWGRVATGASASELDASITRGQRAFMLTGAGRDGHAGHMAVVERVHEIDYDEAGRVERVVFDGWEARVGGAQHLERRTWNRYGNPGGNLARNGFSQIEVVELLAPRTGQNAELPMSPRVGASVHDLEGIEITGEESSSSSAGDRPNASPEARP